MRHHLRAHRLIAAGASLLIGATALATFSQSASADDGATSTRDAIRAELVETVSPEMVDALGDHFGFNAEQVYDRLATESIAMRDQPSVALTLDKAFGGLWIGSGVNEVYVAVTDTARMGEVTAYGYIPTLVGYNAKQLTGFQKTLDAAKGAPKGVTGWHVDVTTNTVVLLAKPGTAAKARAWALGKGVPADVVRVETTTASPRPYADIVGGTAYYIGGSSRCSVGFSVTHPSRGAGFVTAGHCGSTGASVTSGTGAVGSFIVSSFPGNDYAYVDAASSWTATPRVQGHSQQVANANVAPVGSSICRSGSTTGYHCGSVQQLNTSVTYPQGTVSGVTRTNVCAEPGDSGGSFISGASAQGMTSGGSGNCSSGGTTYFQPVGEAVSASGTTLTTTSGPGPGPQCGSHPNNYTGSLASNGNAYQPTGGSYTSSTSGTHSACLAGPSGTDFDLYLQKLSGSTWTTVASSTSPGNQETVSYNGTAGTYRYRVHAYSGSGTYALGLTKPA
ncbi:S1 family peptidase [Phytomonospora sp. NPDC050363]|uniref:S1 family peptidase n=1 Tax=Phytomonospora sp. NPDC050363 TaxID=3155642 RepID=UPI0033E93F30